MRITPDIHMIRRITTFAASRKKTVIGTFSVLAVTGTILGTQLSKTTEPTKYVLSTVARGTVVSTISGSGQVSAENQLDITPEVAGTIVAVLVSNNDEVAAGTPLFAIDQSDAIKQVRDAGQSVRDAEISLESAKISYEKLVSPESNASLLQAQNALKQAERALADLKAPPTAIQLMNAEAKVRSAELNARLEADGTTPKTVRDAWDDEVVSLNGLMVTLKDARDDANDVLSVDGIAGNANFKPLFSVLDQSVKIQAYTSYEAVKTTVTAADDAVKALAASDADPDDILEARGLVTEALKATATLLDDVKAGLEASLTSSSFSQSSLDQLMSTIQSDINGVFNARSTLRSLDDDIEKAQETFDSAEITLAVAKAELEDLKAGADPDDIAKAEETVAERTQTLADVKVGADDIEVKVALNTIRQRESSLQDARDNLQDAQEALNDCTVVAPFNGVVTNIEGKLAAKVSQSTTLATLLTKERIAEISLNEVDITKIKVGQKATLTFDALEDLTVAGTVGEVDIIGSVSQGVVSYGVKVVLETQDDRVRPGMSVSVSIITEAKADVIVVPNAAVKDNGGVTTVQVLATDASESEAAQGIASDSPPETRVVQVGLSDDNSTEITVGLTEGERVVTRTVAGGTQTTQATQGGTSSIRIPGVTGGGGMGGPPGM
ncbi:efflux RND transporter periplasmic adaptor subunit [Patescibacteria group bacterium]|nr:efflux RND transporter periplasmic adaptor subunit [Patescibacteria group bacterium]